MMLCGVLLHLLQSQKLAMDIWNTDWYLRSNEEKKLILIFLIRAQKPLKFDIGPFGVMSLPTFLSVQLHVFL